MSIKKIYGGYLLFVFSSSLIIVILPIAGWAGEAGFSGQEERNDASLPSHTLSLGGGVAVTPKYRGSKESTLTPLPIVDYRSKYGFFLSTTDGAGFGFDHEVGNGISLFASTALSYDFGRKEKDSRKELKGMGKVRGSLTNITEIGINLAGYFEVAAGFDAALTESKRGTVYYLSASTPLVDTESMNVRLSATAKYGDEKYMRAFYGVSDRQSMSSRYKKYTPDAGFHEIEAGLSLTYRLNERWSLNSFAGMLHLMGDAAKSPLVKERTMPIGSIGIVYTF